MKAKPFIKWAGGKSQLIDQLDDLLPADFDKWKDVTYIEPFVGGGAMLFYLLQNYPQIKRAIINDINQDLITCYRTIQQKVEVLIDSLQEVERRFLALPSHEKRKAFFLEARDRYNGKNLEDIKNTTLFIFLNKTCFNGLYRVNGKGKFNVPFGRYEHPIICDIHTLRLDSKLLQQVEILDGEYEQAFKYAQGHTLFYLDPPYRPISQTSSFTAYSKQSFDDEDQIRLKNFCDRIDKAGFHFMLSNSDSSIAEGRKSFFDLLYDAYKIERVWAPRCINVKSDKRGKLTEILVHNYHKTKAMHKAHPVTSEQPSFPYTINPIFT